MMKALEVQLTDEVEVLTDIDNGEVTTGNKRNRLIQRASGEYIVFVDDDDEVSTDYVKEILQAAITKPDAIVFSGWMTTNGTDRRDFHLSIHYPYTAITRNGKIEYLRYPNHITPIKREIALQVPFPNRTIGEDYEWATAIHDQGLIKNEIKIHKYLYHYKFKTDK
jgi:glycosyltransferase involved in cell wall biosynthesis